MRASRRSRRKRRREMPAPGWRRDVAWVMAQVNYTKHSIIPPRVRTRIHACLHVHVHLYASTIGVRDKGRFEPGGCCKHEIGWEEWSRLFEKKKSSRFISCWLFFLSFFLFLFSMVEWNRCYRSWKSVWLRGSGGEIELWYIDVEMRGEV